MEFLTILTCSVVKFRFDTKNLSFNLIFFVIISNFFLLKNKSKLTLQYLFYFFILYNTVSDIKFNFKLKIDPKMCTFKNLDEILKTFKKFGKN